MCGIIWKLPEILTLIQIFIALGGGLYALYLLKMSNLEKRQAFVLSIFDKFYSDEAITDVLYAADKKDGLKPLEEKLIKRIEAEVGLERETDKTLRYLDFIGGLLKKGKIKIEDASPFEYEILTILNNPTIRRYRSHVESLSNIKVRFDNLDFLQERLE